MVRMTGKLKDLDAVVTREGDIYVAQCVQNDVVSQGATPEEAVTMLAEAVELFLEDDQPPQS